MSTNEMRQFLHKYIDQVDSRFLSAMYSMMQTYVDDGEETIGYRPDGTPITKKQLQKRAAQTEIDLKEGNYISMEEIEKESENW